MTFLLAVFFILGALSGILEKRDRRTTDRLDAEIEYYKKLDKYENELAKLEQRAGVTKAMARYRRNRL